VILVFYELSVGQLGLLIRTNRYSLSDYLNLAFNKDFNRRDLVVFFMPRLHLTVLATRNETLGL